MYTKFFRLSRRPFEERADPQFYFPTPHGDEVLAALEYESQYGQSIALLIGEAGTGKTLLIRSLLMRGQPTDQSVVLTWTADGKASVIREACKAFGVTLPSAFSTNRGLARIRRHLSRITADGRRALLVIDQGENLSSENLAEISALTSLHLGDQSMLTVMLAGQPQIKTLLEATELSSLRQRLFGERVLTPFSRSETGNYIAHRLKVAGAADPNLFEPPALDLIHRVSGGIPRLLNRLAGEAMLSAYGASRKTVTGPVVAELVKENAYEEPAPMGACKMDADGSGVDSAVASDAEFSGDVVSRASTSRDRLVFDDASPIKSYESETDRLAGAEYDAGSSTLPDPNGSAVFTTLDPCGSSGQGEEMLERGRLLLEQLERAMARAERMSATSQASLTQTTAVETHLETLVGHAERIAGELGGSVSRAHESLNSLNARIRSEVSTTQDRVTAVEERLAAIPEVLEQADHRLDRLQDACSSAEHVESSLRKFGEELADQADTVQERIGIAVAGTQAGKETLDRATQLIETVEREKASQEQLIRRTAEQVDTKLRTLNQSLAKADRVIESLQTQSRNMTSEAERIKEDLLRKSISRFEESLQQALDRFTTAQLEALDAMESREVELRSQVHAFEERTAGLQRTLHAADHEIDATQKKTSAVATECKKLLAEVATKEQRITHISRDLDNSIERGETHKTDVQRVTGKAEELRRSVAAILVDVGAAQERAVAARAQFDGYKEIVSEIDQAVQRGQSALRDVDEIVSHVDQLQGNIAAVAHEASAKTEAFRSDVDRVHRDLAVVAEDAAVKTEAFRQGVRNVQQGADETIARITQAVAQGSDAIAIVSAEAQTKVTQLDSHNAAARVVLQELSEMNQKGHSLLDQAKAVLEDTEDKTKQAASTIESLWGLAGGAEAQTKALATKLQESEKVVTQLAGEVKSAQAALSRLAEQSSGADAQYQIVEKRCRDAKKIADRLVSISKLLKTAKETEQSITEMVDGARRVADDLTNAAGTSDQLLEQFSRQGEGIAATIGELETRAAKIESTIDQVTEKPAELVRTAKAQAAQLERVCAAVRKVFASLSKTTLEAKKQTEACGKINHSAAQQIRNLRVETDRSCKTLREWIAEAIRVQTRLERSLDQAPSIHQTHPIEELAEVSDRMTVGDAIPEPLAGGELTMLDEPQGAAIPGWADGVPPSESEPAASELGARIGNRADEISRLLADAKNLVP
ncbi:MAG: AAA family ATPase [Phycisphaerae bacterium]